jgi:UDP-2,4-diacetamido-2,4,6-trideoxy-beta-L-altropyranose hydrolase
MISCDYLFFIKAGSKAGFGHLRRSIAIASGLRSHRKNICFLVDSDNAPIKILKEKGFKAYLLSTFPIELFAPKVSVIDQKGDIYARIKKLRSKGSKICLIDNASKARLISDIVIFPVSHFNDNLNWRDFKGKKYLGAEYFPLNPEFLKEKRLKHDRFTILVTMGGSDPNNITAKVAKALKIIKEDFRVIIVIGSAFGKQNIPSDRRFKIVRNPKNMAKLMASSDLALTAFGTTLYELAYMGVPALIISNYAKERSEVDTFGKLGTSISIGYFKDIAEASISKAVVRSMLDRRRATKLSRGGKKLVDGKGVQRIIKLLKGLEKS